MRHIYKGTFIHTNEHMSNNNNSTTTNKSCQIRMIMNHHHHHDAGLSAEEALHWAGQTE